MDEWRSRRVARRRCHWHAHQVAFSKVNIRQIENLAFRLWEFLIAGGPGYCQELLCSALVEIAMRAHIEHTDAGVTLHLSDEEFDDAVATACDHLSSRHGKLVNTRPFVSRPDVT